jgi:cephalosporin-C deacetylase-like acetyl esterase
MNLAFLTCSAFLLLSQADSLDCLPTEQEGVKPASRLYRYLQTQANAALEQRRKAFEEIKTPEQVRAYQARLRAFLLEQIGTLPQRTPLHARIVGTLQGEDYRIEKVLFESQPHHHVAGVVYLPSTKPPYPGVIIPCGHSHSGKAADGYQRVGILLAKNGIAAMCYDPIGQGERYQIFGPRNPASRPNSKKLLAVIPGQPEFDPVEEHTLLGIGSILVGTNTARYRIWDGIRSLDYLASRSDIDATRLGCTGNSGGGTLTSYLMALDERIVCAAPGCYLTTFRRLLETSGPQDAEQNIAGQIAFGLDQADFVHMRAPRPTVILAATRDATFDIAGTWDIFREAKRFYARLDAPERVDMVEADAPHGFTIQLRIAAVRWMRRWLLGKDDAITEPDFPVWTYEQLQCTPKGQVMQLDGERSVLDMNRDIAASLEPRRQQIWKQTPREVALQQVRTIAGIRSLSQLPAVKHRKVGTIERQGYRIDKLVLEPEAGIVLPALAFMPAKASEVVLYVHGDGKRADAGPGGLIEKFVHAGKLVLAVDLRGIGDTEGKGARDWSRSLFGPNGQEFFVAYMLGKSLVGQRTEDILCAARFLASYERSDEPRRVHLVGIGVAGIPALHAMALERQLFASLTLQRSLASWTSVLHTPLPENQLTSVVHGALRHYDLPDLERALEGAKVTVEDRRDAAGTATAR